MECAKIRKYLDEYIDDTLNKRLKPGVEKHLVHCRLCQEELESLKAYREKIGSLPRVHAPDNFLRIIHERLERPTGLKKIFHKMFISPKIRIPLEFATAAVAVIAVVFVFNVMIPSKRETKRFTGEPRYQKKTVAPGTEEKREKGPDLKKRSSVPSTEEKEPMEEELELSSMKESVSELGGETEQQTLQQGRQAEYAGEPSESQIPMRETKVLSYEKEPERIISESDSIEEPAYAGEDEKAEGQQAVIGKGLFEITLVIGSDKPVIPQEREETPDVMQALEMEPEKKDERAFKGGIADEDLLQEEEPLQEAPQGALLARLESLLEAWGGEIVSVEYESGVDPPSSVIAEVPGRYIETLLEELSRFGNIENVPESFPEEEKSVKLRISFGSGE